MRNTLIFALAGAAALSFMSLSAASAADHHLQYNAQELETVYGAKNVYKRIAGVARAACGDEYRGAKLVKYRSERDRCVAERVQELVATVDHPHVYEAHAAAGGHI